MVDGKTEWFIITYNELREAIMKIKEFMKIVYNDCGSEELIPHETRNNVESKTVANRTRKGVKTAIQQN